MRGNLGNAPAQEGDSSLIGEALDGSVGYFFAIGAHNKTSAPWLNESLEAFKCDDI